MEVADQGHVVAAQPEPLADLRHRRGRLVGVDRDAHDLGAGVGELVTCSTVAATSAVSVLVIDWTTTGAPPPITTPPTRTAWVRCRSMPLNATMFAPSAPAGARPLAS